jgi:hypothetical protein
VFHGRQFAVKLIHKIALRLAITYMTDFYIRAEI